MTENTKSLIKSTILGLLGGSTATMLYALKNRKNELSSDSEFKNNEITVPLSRRQFLKAVRPERLGGAPKIDKKETKDSVEVPKNLGALSPKDMAALKKSLLRKGASDSCGSCGSKCSKVTTTETKETPVRRIAGAGSTYPRDKKGRFASEPVVTKKAGILDEAGSAIAENVGFVGGTIGGMAAVKMITDRILLNKKKRQVEAARKLYADAVAKEVNDDDLPYYSKSASDKSYIGQTLGLLGFAGLTTGTAAAAVMYRIMENRRKEAEKAKDKDLAKYPLEKTIKFRFPKDGTQDFFG